jgi:polyferredoxin
VQISNLFTLNLPAAAFGIAFLVAVVVPILVIIFGNIYCGYLCPFGSLQELLSTLTPGKLKTHLSADTARKLSFVKYLLLFVFIIAFFVSRNQSTLSADPLVSIFSRSIAAFVIAITAVALVGSLFYTRLFCRFLCPTGSFLSLLNRISLLKKLLPTKRFRSCEFGITPAEQADCIYCDRCRYLPDKIIVPPSSLLVQTSSGAKRKTVSSYILITVVVAAAIFISAATLGKFQQTISAASSQLQNVQSALPIPENSNLQKIRTLIKQNMLSDKEALFYNRLDEQNAQKTDQNSFPQRTNGQENR